MKSLFLCVVLSLASPAPAFSLGRAAQDPAGETHRKLHCAYWTTGGSFDTVVLLSNPDPVVRELTLRALSKGELLDESVIRLEPLASASVSLRDRVKRAAEGRLELDIPDAVQFLPAQALISDGANGWTLDFEDERNMRGGNFSRTAPLPFLGQAGPPQGIQHYVVLSNAGESPIQGTIEIVGDRGGRVDSWAIPAGGARTLHIEPRGARTGESAAIRLRSESGAGLLAAGFARLPGGGLVALHFYDDLVHSGGELAGFFSGPRSELTLFNGSTEDVEAVVGAVTKTDNRSRNLVLAAGEAAHVALQRFLDLPEEVSGAVTVSLPENSLVVGEIVDIGPGIQSSALRDTRKETNEAYGFAVRLSPRLSSVLRVYNPNDFEVEMCLFLYFGETRYTYPLKKLGPGRQAVVDLLKAQREGLPGENGGVIPLDATRGLAKVIMHHPGAEKNLVVAGEYVNPQSEERLVVQGCYTSPPIVTKVELEPDAFEGFPGQEPTFMVIAHFDDGSIKDVASSGYTYSYTNKLTVATVFGDNVLRLLNPGSATLTSEHETCVSYTPGFFDGEGGRQHSVCEAMFLFMPSAQVNVNPFTLQVTEVSFLNDHTIYKDLVGSAAAISDPVWKDANADTIPEKDEPVAYTRGGKVALTAKFRITPTLSQPITGVTIEGNGSQSLDFRATGVTLNGSEVTIPLTMSDDPLPNLTTFLNPMNITWRYSFVGPNFRPAGSSSHKLYATLANPLNGSHLYLTVLHLAVSNSGASTQAQAVQKTWSLIAGPSNLRTWDNRPLYYYRPGEGFSACATDSLQLLTQTNGSGMCGSFANLMIDALGANGIPSSFTQVRPTQDLAMLVKNWRFGAPFYISAPDYRWRLLNLSENNAGMVPLAPGGQYGDMTSLSGVAGQNTPTPSEKFFGLHFIVKVTVFGLTGGPYYDPSYGITYANADDFEAKALAGYASLFLGEWRVRTATNRHAVSLVP